MLIRLSLRRLQGLVILFCDGDVREAALFPKTAPEVIVTAVDGTGAASAPDKVMAVGGFDFIAAQIAADGVFDDLHGKAPFSMALEFADGCRNIISESGGKVICVSLYFRYIRLLTACVV